MICFGLSSQIKVCSDIVRCVAHHKNNSSSPDRQRDSRAGQSARDPDAVNLKILEVLRDDGRISIAALAERVGISRANAYTRVGDMVEQGVITGYAPRVDPAKVGLGICALVFVSVHPQTWEAFRARIIQMPDIESCRITTGEHDAMLLIRAGDVGTIHEFVIGEIAALPQVKSVETVLVLDEVFQRPYLLPTDLPERPSADAGMGLMRFTRANPDRPGLNR